MIYNNSTVFRFIDDHRLIAHRSSCQSNTTSMPQSISDYDSQHLSSERRRGLSFLPISKLSKLSKQRHQSSHNNRNSIPPPQQEPIRHHNHHQHNNSSSASPSTSAATSRSSTATSPAVPASVPVSIKELGSKAQEIRPSEEIAEWSHQIHMTQGRCYWWCQLCLPQDVTNKPLEIPKSVGKVSTGRRARVTGPSHCYDI